MARLQKKKSASVKLKKRVKSTGGGPANEAGGSLAQSAGVVAKTKKGPAQKSSLKGPKPFTTTKVPVTGRKPSWLQKSIQFLREVKVELKKVTWPSRNQTLGSTVVVIVLVVLISLFLGLVDMGLTSFVRVVLQ